MLCVFCAGGVHRWSAFRKGFVVVVTTIQRFRRRIPPMREKGRLPRRDLSGNGLVRNRQGVAVRTSAYSLIAVHSLFFSTVAKVMGSADERVPISAAITFIQRLRATHTLLLTEPNGQLWCATLVP